LSPSGISLTSRASIGGKPGFIGKAINFRVYSP
jgi:hypothetical protein